MRRFGDEIPMSVLGSAVRAGVKAFDAATAWGEMAASDFLHLDRALDGNEIDAWDPDYIRRVLPVWRFVMGMYFRGEVRGLDNAARLPGTGLSRWGTLAASHDNARKAFDRGAPVLVYPGGDYETFRPSWHSDRIEFGGRKGFVRLALERGVPIVPVVAIGGQETALFVTRGERAARATGWARRTRIKVLPVALAPPFGVTLLDLPTRLPLPSKITIDVLRPIDLEARFGRD